MHTYNIYIYIYRKLSKSYSNGISRTLKSENKISGKQSGLLKRRDGWSSDLWRLIKRRDVVAINKPKEIRSEVATLPATRDTRVQPFTNALDKRLITARYRVWIQSIP